MNEIKNLICIECPRGCDLKVSLSNKEVISIEGNFCPKGKAYAISEASRPMRTLTSSVRLNSGEMVSVKTDKEIAKDKIMFVQSRINETHATKPIIIGQILYKNIDGEGANLVATKNIK